MEMAHCDATSDGFKGGAMATDIVVTGACGFIGRHLVSRLLSDEDFPPPLRIIAVDAMRPSYDDVRVVNIQMDLCSATDDEIALLLHRCAVVVHLAAVVDTRSTVPVSHRLFRVNVQMAKRLASAAVASRAFCGFIQLSSVAALQPELSVYGQSKAAQEQAVRDIIPAARLAVLRPHIVYGCDDPLGTSLVYKIPQWLPAIAALASVDHPIVAAHVDHVAECICDVALGFLFSSGGDGPSRAARRSTKPVATSGSSEDELCNTFFVGFQTTQRKLIVEHLAKRPILVLVLPSLLTMMIVWLVELLDSLLLHSRFSWSFLRVLSTSGIKCMKTPEPLSVQLATRDAERIRQRAAAAREAGVAARSHTDGVSDAAHKQLLSPTMMGPIEVRSRVIKAATFECMRGQQLADFHRKVALRARTALHVVSYGSVCRDGCTFTDQLCLEPSSTEHQSSIIGELRLIADAVHSAKSKVALQLTHAGAFADTRNPISAVDWTFNPLTWRFSTAMSERARMRVMSGFVRAVDLCHSAGFDAVELHCGHGYLLSQCLRAGEENFVFETARRVISEAHQRGMAVLVKFNVDEKLASVVRWMRAFNDAECDVFVPSGGHVMSDGFGMLRGGRPLMMMAKAQTSYFTKFSIALFGPFVIPRHPFTDGFYRMRTLTALFLADVPASKCALIGGISQRSRTAESAILHGGFGFVSVARALLRDPEWAVKKSESDIRYCDHCNRCVVGPTMRHVPLQCITSVEEGVHDW